MACRGRVVPGATWGSGREDGTVWSISSPRRKQYWDKPTGVRAAHSCYRHQERWWWAWEASALGTLSLPLLWPPFRVVFPSLSLLPILLIQTLQCNPALWQLHFSQRSKP